MLISFIAPFFKGSVEAGSTDDNKVYLPLVSKNYQEWLDIFNQYRKVAGLNPVVTDEFYNSGLKLHINYLIGCPEQKDAGDDGLHKEEVCDGWTQIGRDAGGQSNMLWATGPNYTEKQSIDLWMKTERHRYHMLNPDLVESGFSLGCSGFYCFAGLNVIGGRIVNNDIRAVFYPGVNQVNVPPIIYPITVGFYPSSDQLKPILVSKFILFDANGNKVDTTKPLVIDDYVKEIAIKPIEELLPNHRYRVEASVSAGVKTFEKTWYFTTGSN